MRFFERIKNIPANVVRALENENNPFINYILSFFFAVNLRNFIESFSQGKEYNYFNNNSALFLEFIIHINLAYITLAMLIICVCRCATHAPIAKIARIILPGFIILLLAPTLDLLLTHGDGVYTYYLKPDNGINPLLSYVTFFSAGGFDGASVGMKCEILFALIGIYNYFRIKKCGVFTSIFYAWLTYTVIFIWASSPFYIKAFLEWLGYAYLPSLSQMIHVYLACLFFLGMLLFYLSNKKLFFTLMKNLPYLRLFHYVLMLLLGVTLALLSHIDSIALQLLAQEDSVIDLFFCMISLFFLSQTITLSRDGFAADRTLAYLPLTLALVYAAAVGMKAFLIICVVIGCQYIYSTPPLLVKRITFFSKLLFSLSAMALIVLGYTLIQDSVINFPYKITWIYLIGFTLAVNLIDLNTLNQDKAAGILTLPILLRESYAKIIIGLGVWFTYIAFASLTANKWVTSLLVFGGGLQFLLINKKTYREWPILAFYNISILLFIGYLLIHKSYEL